MADRQDETGHFREGQIGRFVRAVQIEAIAPDEGGAPNDFGALPMTVLSDPWVLEPNDPPEEIEAASIWNTMGRELALKSTRGKWILVAGSGHMISLERSDAVVDAIRSVAEQLRQH